MTKQFTIKELHDVPFCKQAISKLCLLGKGNDVVILGQEKISSSTVKIWVETEKNYESIFLDISKYLTPLPENEALQTKYLEHETGKLIRQFLKLI